jgi:hypothetical protein
MDGRGPSMLGRNASNSGGSAKMRRMHRLVLVVALVATSILAAVPVAAQTIGIFRWQLVPYCNIVSVAITQTGTIFRLDGTDDQCGAGTQASVTGEAYLNPNGTIGFGFAVVSSPGATPVHVSATVTLPALNGSWRDDSGNSGAFVLTPGAGIGGSPRPNATHEVSVDVFRATAIGTTMIDGGGCRTLSTMGNSALVLGLSLPLGAVITQVRVKLIDLSVASGMTVRLVADDYQEGTAPESSFGSQLLASPDSVSTTVPLILNANAAVPVSDVRSYQIEATTMAHTGTLSFCGALVRYTVP